MRTVLLVLTLWAAGLCAAAQFAKVGVPLAEISALYPQAGSAIGFLVTLVSAVGVVAGLFAGMLGSRFGLRRLLLGALWLGAILSLVQSTLPPFPIMLGLRGAEGLSHLGVVVAAPTLIGTVTPSRWRPAAMTLWGTFFGVAFALTAWAGLPLVERFGPAALFVAHGVATAAVAAALAFMLREPEANGQAGERLTLPLVVRRHRTTYASPSIAAPALGWLFYTFTFVALTTVLPQLVPPEERTLTATLMPLASIAVSLTFGIALLRSMSAVGVVLLGLALSAAAAALMIATGVTAWGSIALLGTLGLVQGASFAAIPDLNPAPNDQALANGGMAQMGNLGNLAGTPVLLWALGAGGVTTTMGLAVISYAAAFALHVVLARKRKGPRA